MASDEKIYVKRDPAQHHPWRVYFQDAEGMSILGKYKTEKEANTRAQYCRIRLKANLPLFEDKPVSILGANKEELSDFLAYFWYIQDKARDNGEEPRHLWSRAAIKFHSRLCVARNQE